MEITKKLHKKIMSLRGICRNNLFLIILFFIFISCKSPVITDNKEQLIIKEKVLNSSFDVGGIARQDTIRTELYYWDTIIKRLNKVDTIRTSFNEMTKYQTLKLASKPDTLRDTTFIKIASATKYIEVVPRWSWWCLFIAIAEFVIIVLYINPSTLF